MEELAIAVASSGDNTIIPAQGTNRRIIIHELFLSGVGDVNGFIRSGAAGTIHFASAAIRFPFTAGGGFLLNGTGRRWTGDVNATMNLVLSGAIGVSGYVIFDTEPDVQGEG